MMKRKSKSEKVFSICNISVMMIFTVMCAYPFYYMLIYSVSDPTYAGGVSLMPVGFTLENYAKVFTLSGFGRAAVVSVSRTIIGTAITVGSCGFFGYLVTKEKMVGRKVIYRLLVVTMYVDGGLIPTYLVLNAYGLVNNYLVYILPTALSAYNVMLIKTFVEQLPASLEESARIDGASTIRCFRSIILPLSKPILATITVFSAVSQWNAWFDSHIYMTRKSTWSLQYILHRYLQQAQYLADALEESGEMATLEITPETVRMTITAVVTIPILFVYPFMQKYFMKGMLIGAVKG